MFSNKSKDYKNNKKDESYKFYSINNHKNNCNCKTCEVNKSQFKSKYFKFN